MTEDQKEKWGQLIDSLENYQCALNMPIPAEMHVDQLRKGLSKLVPEMKASYIDITGENPWE